MYAAYQSGQFASRCRLRFSRSPWAAVACGGRAGGEVGLRICVVVDSAAPSVDGELCAINETGTVRRREDNRFSDETARIEKSCEKVS
jgi:hypothetical protein